MGISFYKIKKWYKMLSGTSIMHVNQNEGLYFEPNKLKGYFNNLTEKVLKDPETIENRELPSAEDESGNPVVFPVTIFQYGLGAFDLYLQKEETVYLDQFMLCARWAVEHQMDSGAWSNFHFVYPENPYGAMCQGEGASLLLRAYKVTGESCFLDAAKKALNFMLMPIEEGGTAKYEGDDLILLEYTHLPAVLNGWIFALFGLYDIVVSGYGDAYRVPLEKTVKTLAKCLPYFDNRYWSMYDLDGKITSPFYHKLHIAQLSVMAKAFDNTIFGEFATKWDRYQKSFWNPKKAFLKKAIQKIVEKD